MLTVRLTIFLFLLQTLSGCAGMVRDLFMRPADNIEDLLAQLNGKEVTTAAGTQKLDTNNFSRIHMEQDWRTRLLMVIEDPNIAYMLMLLGISGLFFELANPGYVLPGVVGGTALLLALYAFQVLPVNYAGLALIVPGISFMVAEA